MSRKFTLPAEVPSQKKKESFKIAVLGDSGVGKSTVTCRLLKHWSELATKSRSKKNKKMGRLGVVGRDLDFHLMNTSTPRSMQGLERCDVYVLVYSLVDDGSFRSACAAREHILATISADAHIVFVANKTDVSGSVDAMARCSRHFSITGRWKLSQLEISAETDPSVQGVLDAILTKELIRSPEIDRTDRIVHGRSGPQKDVVHSSTVSDNAKKNFRRRNGLDFTSFCSY